MADNLSPLDVGIKPGSTRLGQATSQRYGGKVSV